MDWSQNLYIFSSIVTSIFLEAAPFLAFGALLSALMEHFVSPDRMSSLIPKNRYLGLLFGVAAGMALPTCECGVVPVARRLLAKGAPPHVAISYMLAAPVINPIVIASTYVAFRGDLWILFGRVFVVGLTAFCVGSALFRLSPEMLLRGGNGSAGNDHDNHDHHHHDHDHDSCCDHVHCDNHDHEHSISGFGKFRAILIHAAEEFLDMGRYLILGALAAGVFKTFLSQAWLTPFQNSLVLSVCVMMVLAVLLSICSEADAFVAASFTSFPGAAQLAFVTIGPMVDLKLMGMFASTFHPRLFLVLITAPTIICFLASVIFGFLFG